MASKVFKYGDSVDTDVILPARYLALYKPEDLALHCMEDIDAAFPGAVKPGDVIVAGENFGCGSSREHAPLAIKASGISCVIAVSFARIFYRNAINIGLPIFESPEAAKALMAGGEVEVDIRAGTVKDVASGVVYRTGSFPESIQRIINAGGLLKSLEK